MDIRETIKGADSVRAMRSVIEAVMRTQTHLHISTCPCDDYGWSKKTHILVKEAVRGGIDNVVVESGYNHEVYDWDFVRKA